jgi:DNA-binding XRE family transcriptional regulator
MSDFKTKMDKVTGAAISTWKEKTEERRANKWFTYSAEIAKRVLAAIDRNKDLNQAKLAEVLNVSPQQISKIVKGRENLTLETIFKLSEALQIDLISFPVYEYSKQPTKDSKKGVSGNG